MNLTELLRTEGLDGFKKHSRDHLKKELSGSGWEAFHLAVEMRNLDAVNFF